MSPGLLPVLLIVCIYILVQLLFSLEILIPPVLFGFDWACFFFFFNCSPSSHFVFSILSLEAMSRPAVGTPLSPIGLTVALSLQLTLRPLNISMFQVGAGTVCVSLSCHSVECSLCNSCLVSIVSHRLPWDAPSGFGTASGLAERSSALRMWGFIVIFTYSLGQVFHCKTASFFRVC